MASDTTLASSGIAVDDCAGFAEPADILTRLDPDDLHPARLAGPHAWHPWGLTVAPPTDRRLRLILPAGTRANAADQLLERLEAQLGRTLATQWTARRTTPRPPTPLQQCPRTALPHRYRDCPRGLVPSARRGRYTRRLAHPRRDRPPQRPHPLHQRRTAFAHGPR